MSRPRTATSVTNGKVRRVVQHAKLPPRKRPNGRALERLIRAATDIMLQLEGQTGYRTKELDTALAPYLRYLNGEGVDMDK